MAASGCCCRCISAIWWGLGPASLYIFTFHGKDCWRFHEVLRKCKIHKYLARIFLYHLTQVVLFDNKWTTMSSCRFKDVVCCAKACEAVTARYSKTLPFQSAAFAASQCLPVLSPTWIHTTVDCDWMNSNSQFLYILQRNDQIWMHGLRAHPLSLVICLQKLMLKCSRHL